MGSLIERRDDKVRNSSTIARAARLAGSVEAVLAKATKPLSSKGFPYRRPNVPRGVTMPRVPSKLGADYDTAWARKYPARFGRVLWVDGPMRLFTKAVASPTVKGLDRLEDLRALKNPPPLIFTPNHHSHLDTPLSIYAIPEPWRHKLIVAAAADYFFTTAVKGGAAALALNALPIDRDSTGRKSGDQIRDLMADGWSLLIYPEGGRSPDGWGQDFKGGAAYLSSRTGAAVVPMFIDGSGPIFGKGMKRPKPGRTTVVFGRPIQPAADENTRRFNARIEAAVALLGDESLTDYWTSRRNRANGTNPKLTGPEYNNWRRQWSLTERRQLGDMGVRRRQKRRWPDLG
ncbi:MAG: lysophospholipid acyltransferase family protein [Ilumatobacteraceae bacterium]